jgi:hypothetical protein
MGQRQAERKKSYKEATEAKQREKLLEPNRSQLLEFYPVFLV